MKYAALAGLLLAQSAAKENNTTEAKEYIKIAEGILNGTIGDNDITACIADAEAIYADAQQFYQDFEAKDYTDAIKDATDLVQQVESAVSDCGLGKKTELKQIAHEFNKPVSMEWNVKGKLVHNNVEISDELKNAAANWQKKDLFAFGQQIGAAASKVHNGKETQLEAKKENFAKVTQGLLKAYGGKFDLEALLFCIYDEDQAALMLDVAYQAFQQFLQATTTEDRIGGLVGTAIGVYGGYQQFEQGLPACEHVWTSSKFDTTQIKKDMTFMGNAIQNVPELMENIKGHEQELIDMAQNVNGDMEKFGEFFGHFLRYATEAPSVKHLKLADVEEPENKKWVVAEFMQGFLEATKVGTFNFTALLDCIYFADQDAILIYEVIENTDWKDFDMTDAFIMLCGAGVLFGQVQETIASCEAVDPSMTNWTELNKITKIADKSNITTLNGLLKLNNANITGDFKQAILALKKKEYKEFGELLGNALMLATHAEENNLFLY